MLHPCVSPATPLCTMYAMLRLHLTWWEWSHWRPGWLYPNVQGPHHLDPFPSLFSPMHTTPVPSGAPTTRGPGSVELPWRAGEHALVRMQNFHQVWAEVRHRPRVGHDRRVEERWPTTPWTGASSVVPWNRARMWRSTSVSSSRPDPDGGGDLISSS
jgi:hypothetical protein